MRADSIASRGRTGVVSAIGVSTSGRLSRLLGLVVRSFVNAYMTAAQVLKVFTRITQMDRVFNGNSEM